MLKILMKKSDKTIVFLHGWPGSYELFEYQYDYIDKYIISL
jgi:non-heme chloroperoxidase